MGIFFPQIVKLVNYYTGREIQVSKDTYVNLSTYVRVLVRKGLKKVNFHLEKGAIHAIIGEMGRLKPPGQYFVWIDRYGFLGGRIHI